MRIDELNRKELLRDVDTWTKNKTHNITSAIYLGMTEDYTMFFRVPSSTGRGTYTVRVTLADYPEIAQDEDLDVREKVRLAITGNLKLHCNCPAFLYYGYDYILSQLDARAHGEENRFPRIKNPHLQGVMCKHCLKVMEAFPYNWTRAASDIQNNRFMRY